MSFPKSVVVATSVTDIESLRSLRKMNFLAGADIHLVHVVPVTLYADFLSLPIAYPVDEDRDKIRDAILPFMKTLVDEVIPENAKGRTTYDCLFDLNPKERICKFAHEKHADLIIVGTREHRGVFEGSFAHYFSKHIMTNLLILRPEHKT